MYCCCTIHGRCGATEAIAPRTALQNTTGRAGGSIVPDAPRPLADRLETAHHTFR